MNARTFGMLTFLTSVAITSTAFGQKSYPMLMSLSPVASQTGQSSEHTLEARYSMFGATQVLVSGEGVSGEVVTPMTVGADGKEPALTQIKLKFTVAADAVPGVRDFRIIGPTGPSTVGQLVITSNPVVTETPKNDSQELAQAIELPVTVCGAIEKAEDVDFFRFSVTQPMSLIFHCRGMRLQDKIHDLQAHLDPIISVRDAKTGSTLAAADNNFAADPLLTHAFEPGEYLLEVRDVRYQGNKYWNYAIEVSDRPFVSQVYPPVVTRGQSAQLRMVGSQVPADFEVGYLAPSEMSACTIDVTLPMPSGPSNPVPLAITELPVLAESDGDNQTGKTAQAISVPVVVSGRIESEGDIDCYAFDAKKGDRLCIEVLARRNQSGLDSIVRILNDQNKALTENDDGRLWGKRDIQDSIIENWTAPADGRYTLEIRDVHLRGGAEYVYSIEFKRAEPDFEVFLDTDKTWLTPGSCSPIFVRAIRKNGFDGEIQLHVDGLPAGVKAHCGRILSGKSIDGCIVLEADPGAAPVAANLTVSGTAIVLPADAEVQGTPKTTPSANPDAPAIAGGPSEQVTQVTLRRIAQPMQEIYMPGGGRNHWPVKMHTVAVGLPSDIRDVKLSTYEVNLKPGESTRIDVELERSEGFDKNVTLDVLFQHLSSKFADTLPPGVTIDAKGSQTLLTGSNNKGAIVLKAAKDAAVVEKQQCCVMANVSINFVMKATYSSRPILVSVQKAE